MLLSQFEDILMFIGILKLVIFYKELPVTPFV